MRQALPENIRCMIDGTVHEQAYFLYKYASESSWSFECRLSKMLQDLFDVEMTVKAGVKSNVQRIAQKIHNDPDDDPFKIIS